MNGWGFNEVAVIHGTTVSVIPVLTECHLKAVSITLLGFVVLHGLNLSNFLFMSFISSHIFLFYYRLCTYTNLKWLC